MNEGVLERAARFAGMDGQALAGLAPFVEAGVVDALDLQVALHLGARLGERDPDVLLAAALAVRAPRRGHVCVDLRELQAASLLSEPEEGAERPELSLPSDRADWCARVAASPLVRPPGAGATPFVLRRNLLSTDRYHHYERSLLEAMRRRFAEPRPVARPDLLRAGLDALFPAPAPGSLDRQRLAAAMALLRGAVVVSGGPGTGKTWTVRNLLTLLFAQWAAEPAGRARPRIALAAPTGKAAARVVEAIRAGLDEHLARAAAALPPGVDVTELRAFLVEATPWTLHRLLGWRPDDPTRFRHHAGTPLPYDVVLVDEASMVDLALMAKLVDAVPPHARLVLLGDRHQLASVEAGTVLADLCGAGVGGGTGVRLSADAVTALRDVAGLEVGGDVEIVPEPGPWDAVVFLTVSRRFREDSGIGRFARAAVRGEVEAASASLPAWPAEGPGPLAVERGRVVGPDIGRLEPGVGGELPPGARRLIVEGYRTYLERLRTGPRDGESLEAFHAAVLQALDAFRVLCAHRQGRLGVRGLNDAVIELLQAERLLVPRGPWFVGRPVLVTRNDYGVRRFNGDVGVVVRDAQGEPVVAFPAEGGRVAYLAPVRLPEHETVFAMTIHKSQGSEFDDVLVVLPEERSAVVTRELVYTGVTRAKHRVTVLGADPVLRAAVARRVERASGMAEALWAPGTSSD